MCDPLVGGLIASAASLGVGAMQSSQLQATQDAQEAANAQWVAYQTQIHQEQVQQENMRRQEAEKARQATLDKTNPDAQKDIQSNEQQRLTQFYQNPDGSVKDPTKPQDYALSGQDTTGNKYSAGDLAAQVSNATSLARQRVAALATANSFGGSFGGLGTEIPIRFNQGAGDINLQNNIRNANLKTYGVEQQVQPIHYEVGSGTEALGGIAKALGGLGGSLVGKAAASWS